MFIKPALHEGSTLLFIYEFIYKNAADTKFITITIMHVHVCQLSIQWLEPLKPPPSPPAPSLIKESGQGVAMETRLYNSCHSD